MSVGKWIAALVVVCLIVCPSILLGDSILTTNGSFETGDFTGWQRVGDTLLVNSSFGIAPAAGTYQALINDGGVGGVPNPGYPVYPSGFDDTYSGTPLATANGPLPSLENFLGISVRALQNACVVGVPGEFPFPATCQLMEGSAIQQSFTGSAGNVLSFNFDYLSDDNVDFAFAVVDGTVAFLGRGPYQNNNSCVAYPLAPFPPYSSGSLSSPTGYLFDCGYQTFSTTLTSSGTHRIGVGVVGVSDNLYGSAILVDNFQLTSTPEPSSWLLLGTGLLGLIVFRKKSAVRGNPVGAPPLPGQPARPGRRVS
jgi:hypothetical protein